VLAHHHAEAGEEESSKKIKERIGAPFLFLPIRLMYPRIRGAPTTSSFFSLTILELLPVALREGAANEREHRKSFPSHEASAPFLRAGYRVLPYSLLWVVVM